MKLFKLLIAVLLILCMSLAPAALAAPHGGGHFPPPHHGGGGGGHHHHPGPQPIHHDPHNHHHYDHHHGDYYDNDDILIGCGVGLLLGAITNNDDSNSDYEKQQQHEKERAEVREKALENSKKETDHATDLIAINGLDGAIDQLVKSWKSESKETFIDDRNGICVLKITGFTKNIKIEYTFNRESKKVTVRVTVPDYSVKEETSAYYKEPIPLSASTKYMGFDLSEQERDNKGHMLVTEVVKGTAAAYAGITRGDLLVMVDNYDTKDFDTNRINAYIENKAKVGSMIKVTFAHLGKVKTAEIHLSGGTY